ncbi:MAG: 4-hydroxybenzoate 3-monooxygenase [Acidimicrobiia bacterium]|nr:4-hydroxybenzoate 3-monooxygenase [Acidimicrobiia bacterium]
MAIGSREVTNHTSQLPTRTQVAIIGGGPAGTLLSYLLHLEGVASVVLELRSREHVLGRVRAGVIEYGSAGVLRAAGLGDRMDGEGFVHDGVNLAFANKLLRIDFGGLVGKHVVIYGQTQLQKDLYDAMDREGIALVDEAEQIEVHDIETTTPRVIFDKDGESHSLSCDYVVGCDGAHGTAREYIPSTVSQTFERLYPFVWVGLLSETPPVNDELIYANHLDGFALCSMRNENLSRYYVQGSAEDTPEDWPDERFWEALERRLPTEAADRLVTGPSIEKLVTPLRSWVSEPLSYGRLYLAGDAAHVVPPTGAKGLNLAISDVVYLASALSDFYTTGSTTGLDEYSATALSRVWKAVRFSWWLTALMHRFSAEEDFDRRLQMAELDYLFSSEAAQRAMAENYVGLLL